MCFMSEFSGLNKKEREDHYFIRSIKFCFDGTYPVGFDKSVLFVLMCVCVCVCV